MTKRRKLLIATATVGVLAVTLAMPPVHWRLYGWARGEPFYQDRPASYWSAEIAACEAEALIDGCGMRAVGVPDSGPMMSLTRHLSPLDRARQWLADQLGRPDPTQNDGRIFRLGFEVDPAALPVLIALLADDSPQVRYYAAQCVLGLHEAGRPALNNLRALANDKSVAFPTESTTVADAVGYPIYMLENDFWRK